MSGTPSRRHKVANAIHEELRRVAGKAASKDAVTADDFVWRYACEKYLSKYDGDSDQAALSAKCVQVFKETEAHNRSTNLRIRSLALTGPALFCLDEARRQIANVLGRFNVNEFVTSCDWGPGATATLIAEDATLDQKILEPRLSVSRTALPWAAKYLSWDYHWWYARTGIWPDGPFTPLPTEFDIVDSERWTTVRKDTKSRRGISIQPTMNLFLQKGVGKMIRNRLKRVGINLDDQTRNQWLASQAYRLGLSTIDLAKASDTLCYQLVRHLVDDRWWRVLTDLRCPSIRINGEDVHLEKFSAMGNGFTFELESLIFWALIRSVEKRFELDCIHGVFGDDLVVEGPISGAVCSLLSECGFSVNVDKTFTEGFFYESCGKHYFAGVDVTPPFQKEIIKDLPAAIRAANRLWRFACRASGGAVVDDRVHSAWMVAVQSAFYHHEAINASRWQKWAEGGAFPGREPKEIPFPFIPCWLPDDFGLCWPRSFSSRNGFVHFDRLTFSPLKKDTDGLSIYANLLRKGGSATLASYGFVSPRGRNITGFGRGRTSTRTDVVWPSNWPLAA